MPYYEKQFALFCATNHNVKYKKIARYSEQIINPLATHDVFVEVLSNPLPFSIALVGKS